MKRKTVQSLVTSLVLIAIAASPCHGQTASAVRNAAREILELGCETAAREPELTTRLVRLCGKDALVDVMRNPAGSARLVTVLGADGIKIGKTLVTDPAIPIVSSGQLPGKKPGTILDHLETHPKVLLTVGGVATVIAARDNLFGKSGAGEGRHVTPGFIERQFGKPLMATSAVLVGGIAGWVLIQLWGVWRIKTIRNTLARMKVPGQAFQADQSDELVTPAPSINSGRT